MTKLALLLFLSLSAYADGIRQPSGTVARVGINGRTPSPGSHSRERIDGQYSAMPAGAAGEVQGLVSTGQIGTVAPPGDVEEAGGAIVGPPQPMESASPEPSAWVLVASGFLIFALRLMWRQTRRASVKVTTGSGCIWCDLQGPHRTPCSRGEARKEGK